MRPQDPNVARRASVAAGLLLGLAGILAGCKRATKPPPASPPPAAARDAAAPPADAAGRPRFAPAQAIARAASWMAAFPEDQLRYDAAIGLAAIRAKVDDEALRRADVRARAVADRDPDNPLRRAFDEAYRTDAAHSAGWTIPGPGQKRANVNRVVAEALHCRENGLRPETLTYATGPMRDDGGYQTTHALWALSIARDRGCLPDFPSRTRPLVDELRAAQPPAPDHAALALDLFAERLLVLELAGERGPALDGWAAALLAAQDPDGGFGTLAPGEDPYHRYHATMLAAWALAMRTP